MIYSLIFVIILLYFYTFGISTYKRHFSSSVLRHGSIKENTIALTFDDGPHPIYTPKLLDIFNEYSIKVTFFLVTKNAIIHPEIIQRMLHEGHEVGLHTFSHKHAWLLNPWSTYMDFKKSQEAFLFFFNISLKWFRPPWGTFNLFTDYFAKKFDMQSVYWSVETNDWSAQTSSEMIHKSVTTLSKAGSIIVLHDNNGANISSMKMIESLPKIITDLTTQGYHFVTLHEMEVIGSDKNN